MLRRRGGDGVGFEILDGDGALMDLIFFVRGGDGFQLQTPCRPLVCKLLAYFERYFSPPASFLAAR